MTKGEVPFKSCSMPSCTDFRVGIDTAGCLVQNQDARIGYHRAGKGELLADGRPPPRSDNTVSYPFEL